VEHVKSSPHEETREPRFHHAPFPFSRQTPGHVTPHPKKDPQASSLIKTQMVADKSELHVIRVKKNWELA